MKSATELFMSRGYAAVSLSAIAGKAKVTQSLIAHHFENKAGLWMEVKRSLFHQYFVEQMRQFRKEGERLGTLVDAAEGFFRFLEKNPDFVRLTTWMFLEGDTELADIQKEINAVGLEEAKQAQARGNLRKDVHPGVMILGFVVLCEGWVQKKGIKKAFGLGDMDDKAFLGEIIKLFSHGIMPRSGTN